MDNEPYRDPTHTEAIDIIATYLRERRYTVKTELALPDGRIADIAALSLTGTVEIWEVKTYLKDSLIADAAAKYTRWSTRLTVAVCGLVAQQLPLALFELCDFPSTGHVGIAGVYPDSLAVLRRPKDRIMLHDRRLLMASALSRP